jgi:glycosyltransferase involved in cell wall biosynthesis
MLDAPLFAAAVRRGPADGLTGHVVRTSLVQPLVERGVPLAWLAPLLPSAFGRLDVGDAEVVVSSSAAFAHHVGVPRGAVHICYCHTPPRFLWEPDDYFRDRPLERLAVSPAMLVARRLDRAAASRVDIYVANSQHVASKIRRVYGREPLVIHPPVDVARFHPTTERSGRFLVVSRLRNQKRLDLAIRAATERGLGLDVVGQGPELAGLRRLAGPTVQFLGPLGDEEVHALLARAAGLVVPAIGDFGLTLVEAQASGRPPIAFGVGGALEVIEDGRTGFLFNEPTAAALGAAMERAMAVPLDTEVLRAAARRFDTAVFSDKVRELVGQAVLIARRSAGAGRGASWSGAPERRVALAGRFPGRPSGAG